MPRAIHTVKAKYSPEAVRRKISGTVIVEGVVGIDGVLHDGHVVKSLDAVYGLDEQALRTAADWRFEPGTKNGVPVPVFVSIEISFYLR
jgi:protein TonB